jgi:hypothetical protein
MLHILVVAVYSLSTATGLQDVPLGMCFDCEVTCIKDCSAKYEKEIMADDSLLQTFKKVNTSSLRATTAVVNDAPNPEIKKMFKASEMLAKEYSTKLLIESKHSCGTPSEKQKGCGIAKQCVDTIGKEFANMAKVEWEQHEEHIVDRGQDVIDNRGHKAWTDVSAQEVTIADFPKVHLDTTPHLRSSASVSEQSATELNGLENAHMSSIKNHGHLGLNQAALAPAPAAMNLYPLHPVKLGIFSKGGQSLTQCLTYCFAATCGCAGQGLINEESIPKATIEASKAGYYTDTKPAWKYSPATKEQCGAGVKKIIKGLYIDYYPGVGGVVEVCSLEYFKNKAGASGALGLTDPKDDMEKCDCGVNRLDCHEPDFGCSWNELGFCEFKALKHTRCYHRYKTDPTR